MNENYHSKFGTRNAKNARDGAKRRYLTMLFSVLCGVLALVGVPASTLAGPSMQVGEESFLQINYTFQMWLQNRGYTSAKDSGDTMDFFLRRHRLTWLGQYDDYISFYAQIEAGGDGKGGAGGPQGKAIYFRDGYLTLDLSDPIRFIIGRFKNTFSREGLEACFEPLTIDRAEKISYTPWGGSRDTGIAMWGNLWDAKFQYTVMIADGREGDEVVRDLPRITTRVHLSLLNPEYDYGYRGTYIGTKKVLTIGAAYDYQAGVAYGDTEGRVDPKDYQAWTADIFLEYPTQSGAFTLAGAYMDYSVGNAINHPLNTDSSLLFTELTGYYIKGGYLIPRKIWDGRLQIFARYESSDFNLTEDSGRAGDYDQDWYSAGANYYLNGQRLKVTLEYARIDFKKADNPDDASLQDYSQTTLGLQMIF